MSNSSDVGCCEPPMGKVVTHSCLSTQAQTAYAPNIPVGLGPSLTMGLPPVSMPSATTLQAEAFVAFA